MSDRITDDPGVLSITAGEITYESRIYGSWSVPLRAVRIIGESTNQDGPFLQDWFLIFVTDKEGWFECPVLAAGFDDVCADIERTLGTSLDTTLVGSADFASNILWPKPIVGHPLFTFQAVRPRGIWDRLKSLVCPTVYRTFTPEVAQYLASE